MLWSASLPRSTSEMESPTSTPCTTRRRRGPSHCICLLLALFLPISTIFAEDHPAKAPVPDAPALSKATSTMLDVYGSEIAKARSPEKQSAIAKKLLMVSADVKEVPTRYVIL